MLTPSLKLSMLTATVKSLRKTSKHSVSATLPAPKASATDLMNKEPPFRNPHVPYDSYPYQFLFTGLIQF